MFVLLSLGAVVVLGEVEDAERGVFLTAGAVKARADVFLSVGKANLAALSLAALKLGLDVLAFVRERKAGLHAVCVVNQLIDQLAPIDTAVSLVALGLGVKLPQGVTIGEHDVEHEHHELVCIAARSAKHAVVRHELAAF